MHGQRIDADFDREWEALTWGGVYDVLRLNADNREMGYPKHGLHTGISLSVDSRTSGTRKPYEDTTRKEFEIFL